VSKDTGLVQWHDSPDASMEAAGEWKYPLDTVRTAPLPVRLMPCSCACVANVQLVV
jgi:hypothetical protein